MLLKGKLAIAGGAIAGVLVLVCAAAALVVGPRTFRALLGSEDASRASGAIPEPEAAPGPLTKGEADWPCWRGPTLDGKSAVRGIRKDWSGGLMKLWEADYLCQGKESSTWSAPVVRGNRLVVPGRDATRDLVFCLDPETGALLWLASYEAEAGTGHGPGARATPFIDGDGDARVYTFGRSGDLACWRLRDGAPVWRRSVADVGGEEPGWGLSSSPLVYRDRVIVQGGGKALAVAYDKMTGEVAWKSMEGPAGYAAPALVKTGDATQILVFHGTGLAGVDPDDGREIWNTPWKTPHGANATTPVVSASASGVTVFITSGYKTGCRALKVAAEEVSEIWRSKVIASHHSDPILVGGFLYGYSGQSYQNRGHFKCVGLATGEEMWSTREVGWGTTVWVDGHLLCMDNAGDLFLVRPDPGSFAKVTEFRGAIPGAKHPTWTIPVAANGRLYLRYRQRLICYDLVKE